MSSLFKWLTAILVLAGILASWEPGPELMGHSHPHTSWHELQPLHEISSQLASGETSVDQLGSPSPRKMPSDFHHHTAFDFSSESCTDAQDGIIRLLSSGRLFLAGTDSKVPDSPFSEVEHPPLI